MITSYELFCVVSALSQCFSCATNIPILLISACTGVIIDNVITMLKIIRKA